MALDDSSAPEYQPEIEEEYAKYSEGGEQQMLFSMDTILAEVTALRKVIQERLAYDRVKEEAFNRLYAEVEEVRQERSFQQLRPLLMDLILLYDRIEMGIRHMDGLEGSIPGATQLLQSFRDEVLEILYRREVEVIVVESSTFDRTLQQAIKLQPTTCAHEHNQVARVVRRGFRHSKRILRFEEVIVSDYKANN